MKVYDTVGLNSVYDLSGEVVRLWCAWFKSESSWNLILNSCRYYMHIINYIFTYIDGWLITSYIGICIMQCYKIFSCVMNYFVLISTLHNA